MRKTILYIGWVGFGNHGDDVCHAIFTNLTTKLAQPHQLKLEIKALFPSNFNEYSLARINPDLVVLGAGSLFEPVYLKPLILAQQQGIPTMIWGSGYDSLAPSATAFKVAPDSAYMIRQVVGKADVAGIRGRWTQSMLDQIGAYNPLLEISGDPGLLLDQPGQPLTEVKAIDKPIIGVNWGTAANRVYGGNEARTVEALARFLRELSKDYVIVIYPVWARDIQPCQELAALIGEKNRIITLDRLPSIEELISLYQKAKLTINMKLHANVFSAASNCPFIALAYRSKCFDFADSVGMSDFAISFAAPNLDQELNTAVTKLINHNDEYREELRQHVQGYRSKLISLTQSAIELLLEG